MKIKLFITVIFLCFFLKTNIYSQGPIPIDIVGSNSPQELVNPNTGEFHYSIPILTVPNGAGDPYTLYLNYEGVTPEKEASWVGWGWSCTPGAIIRQVNGFPDDVKENAINVYSHSQPLNNITLTFENGAEIFDLGFWASLGINGSVTLRYNDMTGWSLFGGAAFSANVLGLFNGSASVQGTDNGLDYGITYKTNNIGKIAQTMTGGMLPGYNNVHWGKSWKFPAQQSFTFKDYPYSGNLYILKPGMQLLSILLAGIRAVPSASLTSICYQDVSSYTGIGYNYSGMLNGSITDKDKYMLDFRTERDHPILSGKVNSTKIPSSFANVDLYSVNGPGKKGTFRAFLKFPMITGTQYTESKIDPVSVGGQLIQGVDGGWGLGVSFGSGDITSVTQSDNTTFSRGLYNKSESDVYGDLRDVVFRFVTDNSIAIPSMSIKTPSSKVIPPNGTKGSATIAMYNTTGYDETDKRVNYVNPKNNIEGASIEQSGSQCAECIQGFTIIDEGGNKVQYDLPLNAGNQKEYIVNPATKSVVNNQMMYSNFNPNNALVHNDFSAANSLFGTSYYGIYPVAYLPTAIVSNTYIDNGDIGLDPSDFGSYIKFEYSRDVKEQGINGSSAPDLYKWRIPYNGYKYSNESLINDRDDGGSVQYGMRQGIHLRSIKTKTHIAFFVTNKTNGATNNAYDHGSATNRLDAHLPPVDETVAGTSSYNVPTNQENDNVILEKILLYTLDNEGNPDKLLQTTYFQYDYSLQKNHPATINKSTNGRLTLKKVWSENYDIKETTIIPYEFSYEYPPIPTGVPNEYQQLYSTYSVLNAQAQNPNYVTENVDRWGHYQKNGNQRYQKYMSWNNQTSINDNTFDPAAWQLKKIKMPSGSEMHVQYEQNDYAFVQNRPAMVLASITNESVENIINQLPTNPPSAIYLPNKFYINLSDIPGATAQEVNQLIKEYFIDKGEKIYFRFKYDLSSITTKSEFVKGYTSVKNCGLDQTGTKVWVELGDVNKKETLPLVAAAKIRQFSNIHGNSNYTFPTCGGNESVATTILESAVASVSTIATGVQQIFDVVLGNNCTISKSESYLRLPVVYRKIGGGIRVKRILNYETNTLPGQSPQLYGQEYKYIAFDNTKQKIISSGVAVNEPQIGREENSLVYLLNDGTNSYIDKAVVIDHIPQFEGPLGETLLPAPRVEYSSVIVENINKGPSSIASIKNEYLTTKDFPTLRVSPGLLDLSVSNNPTSINPFTQTTKQNCTAKMEYQFDVVNISGAIKSVENYSYRISAGIGGNDFFKSPPISWNKYEYYNPYDNIPLFYGIDRPLRYGEKGKYNDFLIDVVRRKESNLQEHHEASLYIHPLLFFPLISYGPNEISESNDLKKETRIQVTYHSLFPYRTVSSTDGVQSSSEIKAFDELTGQAVMNVTPDAHNGISDIGQSTEFQSKNIIYSVPAYRNYNGMKSKVDYEDRVISKHDYYLGTFDEFLIDHGSKLTIVAPGASLQNGLSKDVNDQEFVLNELSQILTKGAVVLVDQKEIHSFCFVNNITKLSDRVIADLTPIDGSTLPFAWLDKGTVTVLRSAQSNQCLFSGQALTTRENAANLSQMSAYADEIKKYEGISDKINTALFNTPSAAYSIYYHIDQPLTFTPILSNNESPASEFDLALKYGIAVGDNISLLSLPAVALEIKLVGNEITIRMTKDGILENAQISVNSNLVDLPMEQKLLYTGSERFGVDDDGALTYGTLSNISRINKINWSFRCGNTTRNTVGLLVTPCLQIAAPVSPKSNAFISTGLEATMLYASASTFKQHNNLSDFDYSVGNCVAPPTGSYDIDKFPNVYVPYENFVYRDKVTEGGNTASNAQRNYYAGLMKNSFVPFDFSALTQPINNWIKGGRNEFLSPQGGIAQIKDINGITSAVRFGYNGLLPACSGYNVKSNSATRSIYFQSFENTGIPYVGSGNIVNESAHTGKKSLKIADNSPATVSNCIRLDNTSPTTVLIKFWARNFGTKTQNGYTLNGTVAIIENGGAPSTVSNGLVPKSTIVNPFSSEQWELFEIEYTTTTNQSEISVVLDIDLESTIYIDDLAIMPGESVIGCNVYEESTLRLVAQFDDSHHPVMPQIDAKGVPRRTMIESEAGYRTLMESSVNVPRKSK